MSAMLSARDIEAAFAALAEELRQRRHRGRILVVGGAAIVLLFNSRDSTKDVDAYFVQPEASTIREAARSVARKLALPDDWLNDGAKAYLVGLTFGEVLHESEWLQVLAVSRVQLLAMKLAAWRDAVDRADAALLLRDMDCSAEELWEQVVRFVPDAQRTKAGFAFQDLWETIHGRP